MSDTKAVAVQSKAGTPVILMPQNMSEVMAAADFLSKSALIPSALRGKASDVAIILMTGMELGLGPMQAIQNIAVVSGKPTAEAKLILALIQSRCPEALIDIQSSETKAVVTMKRGQNSYTATWDVERAKKLGLMNKPNYQSQLGTMLKWRAVTDAARTVFPDIIMGLYSQEEAEDLRDPAEGEDKKTNIEAKLAAAKKVTAEVLPPAPAPEVSPEAPIEIELITPEEEPTKANVYSNPLNDYVIQTGSIAGKKLGSIMIPTLVEVIKKVRASGKTPQGKQLEDITRIEQFLEQYDALPPAQGSFAAFAAGPMTV